MKKYDLTLIKDRFRYLRENLGLNQAEFAYFIDRSQTRVSAIETGKTEPTKSWINTAVRTFGANRLWLKTGEGKIGNISLPNKTDQDEQTPPSHETPSLQAKEQPFDKIFIKKAPAQDPRIDMAMQVLQSDTHYAESLDKNIHSFYSAVRKEKVLSEKMQEQDRKLAAQDHRITELEDFIKRILERTEKNPVNFQDADGTTFRVARKQKHPK